MLRQKLILPQVISVILFLQLIPLVLFPPASFSPDSQEWWLPAMLVVLSLVGVIQLVFRHSYQSWPWYLISFAQGFSIISRLMMLFPHATFVEKGVWVIDGLYVILTVISMALSTLLLLYMEWPEVRLGLAHE